MSQLVCKGCGGIIDYEGIEPFTVCECSDCSTELVIPLEIEYLKLERLVTEAYGVKVYEGFDMSNNLNSLIHILDKDSEYYKEVQPIMKQQASDLSTLKHTNICPVVNFGKVQDFYFATEPFMDGFPLSDYTPETQGMLDIKKVVDVIQAVGLGLAVAHHKEFPHHNICPENIHIDARGNVRIKNFFISRVIAEYEHLHSSKSSVSAFFISPEKAESALEDKRGDIFSLGVLFYYMVTGKYPFVGRNEIETVYSRVLKEKKAEQEIFSSTENRMITPDTVDYIPPAAPNKIREEISPQISNLILRMLEYHPFKRPTLPEFLDILSLYQASEDQMSGLMAAQKDMVTTTTRAIPKMGNLNSPHGDKKKKKKRKFFL